MSRMRVRPEKCGPATGWPLQNAHEEREVEVEVCGTPEFRVRIVLREADYTGESRDDLTTKALRLGASLKPILVAALVNAGMTAR